MATLSDIISHMRPGSTFRTAPGAGGFGEIVYWSPMNAEPEPTHQELVAYATANAAAIELWLERRGLNPTRRQLRRVLLMMPGRQGGDTLLDEADAIAAHPTTPREAKVDWQDALEYQRLNPWIDTFAVQLQLSVEETDEIFRAAVAFES